MSSSSGTKVFKSINDFYVKAVHIVFGVVLGQSFFNSANILVPVSRFAEPVGFLSAWQLILVYFLIITSWIGYYKSTNRSQYSDGKLGIARFGTDFLILFLYYYILILVTHKVGNPGELFVYGLPAVFGAYLLWDFFKHLETRKQPKQEGEERNMGIFRTIVWLAEFLILAAVYVAVTVKPLSNGDQWWLDFYATVISIGLIAYYRYLKWKEPGGLLPIEK